MAHHKRGWLLVPGPQGALPSPGIVYRSGAEGGGEAMGPLTPPPCQETLLEEEEEVACCLALHETLLVLVALILLVQLGLRLAVLIGHYLCCLLQNLCGTIVVKETEKPMAGPTTVRKSRSRRPLAQWSEPVVSRRKRWESSPPHPHCVHCTLEPLKLTMNVQNDHLPYKEHQRVGRRPYPDHPTYHSPHCDNCEYETRYRPRTVSAPAAHVIRYRDVACGSSEPMLSSGSNERRNTLGVVNELYPRTQVGETQYHSAGPSPDAEYPGANLTRSRRPTKVYIYPVHPQTPPGSRSPSPERLQRRRGTLGLEEMQEYEPRDRRRSREVEQQGGGMPGLSRFHNMVTGMTTGTAAQTEPPNTKQRHVWPEQPAGPDWVYRPLK